MDPVFASVQGYLLREQENFLEFYFNLWEQRQDFAKFIGLGVARLLAVLPFYLFYVLHRGLGLAFLA